jgi:hypothetical protein
MISMSIDMNNNGVSYDQDTAAISILPESKGRNRPVDSVGLEQV